MANPGEQIEEKSSSLKNVDNEKESSSQPSDAVASKGFVNESLQASPALGFFGSFSSSMPSSFSSSAATTSGLPETKSTIPLADDNMVKLNVYGLAAVNKVTKYLGLGIFHSGIEVYGAEWAYGGFPKPVPSIYRMKKPRDLASLSNINGRFHFIQTIEMDKTKFTYEEIKKIIANLGKKDWYGTNYHLLYRNCNHFSNELCKILCNKTIPAWINRVAYVLSMFPFLIKILPEEYFTPVALQQKLKVEQAQKYQLSKANAGLEKLCKPQTPPEETAYKSVISTEEETLKAAKSLQVPSDSLELSVDLGSLDSLPKCTQDGKGAACAIIKESTTFTVNGELPTLEQSKLEKSNCNEDCQTEEEEGTNVDKSAPKPE